MKKLLALGLIALAPLTMIGCLSDDDSSSSTSTAVVIEETEDGEVSKSCVEYKGTKQAEFKAEIEKDNSDSNTKITYVSSCPADNRIGICANALLSDLDTTSIKGERMDLHFYAITAEELAMKDLMIGFVKPLCEDKEGLGGTWK